MTEATLEPPESAEPEPAIGASEEHSDGSDWRVASSGGRIYDPANWEVEAALEQAAEADAPPHPFQRPPSSSDVYQREKLYSSGNPRGLSPEQLAAWGATLPTQPIMRLSDAEIAARTANAKRSLN